MTLQYEKKQQKNKDLKKTISWKKICVLVFMEGIDEGILKGSKDNFHVSNLGAGQRPKKGQGIVRMSKAK